MVDDPAKNRRLALYAELNEIDRRMWSLAYPGWQFQIGPVHFRRQISSQVFGRVFVLVNVMLGTVGALLIFTEGSAADLGIALVVGAVFALGSFLAQVWSHTVEREIAAGHLLFGADVRAEVDQLRARWIEIHAELNESTTLNE